MFKTTMYIPYLKNNALGKMGLIDFFYMCNKVKHSAMRYA